MAVINGVKWPVSVSGHQPASMSAGGKYQRNRIGGII
jgi:hypothetical protein